MRRLYVGVDGGGSKTSFLCVDSQGSELYEARSGPTNWNGVGKVQARLNLLLGFKELFKGSRLTSDCKVACVCLSIAGVHTSEDVAIYEEWAAEIPQIAGAGVIVCNDVHAALASGTQGLIAGIVCIAGTGMNCFGKHPITREEWHAGGMGPLLGDVGSGYWIGDSVLSAAARENDGRETRSTAFLDFLKAKFGWKTFEEVIQLRYEKWAHNDVAALAPICFDLAEKNDPVALEILNRGATGLAECFSVVLKTLWKGSSGSIPPVDLVCAGSIWKNPMYHKLVMDTVKWNVAPIEINSIIPVVDPVKGAAWIALRTNDSDIKFSLPQTNKMSSSREKIALSLVGIVVASAIYFSIAGDKRDPQ